jgi:hypothetical protein
VSGKYSTSIGASNDTVCTDCPTGTQVSTTGSPSLISCQDCIIGKFNDRKGASDCTYCPEGKYGPTYGAVDATYCTECEPTRTNSEDFTTCICRSIYEVQAGVDGDGDTCACPAGREWKAGDCKPCSEGFFKPEASLDLCTSCNGYVTGSTFSAGATIGAATSSSDCECPALHFLLPKEYDTLGENDNAHLIGRCTACPEGTSCDDNGVDLEGLPVQDGFWRTSNKSTEVRGRALQRSDCRSECRSECCSERRSERRGTSLTLSCRRCCRASWSSRARPAW